MAAEPVVKWVGGKRKLLPQLSPLLPPASDIHYYAEPFVGGGAMLFHVASQWPAGRKKLFRWNINDTNADLMSFYGAITAHATSVADVACRFASKHSNPTYYQARQAFNNLRVFVGDHTLRSPELGAVHAGLFLYLNKCGFNGLYRTNRAGNFNASPNDKATWRPKLYELSSELGAAAGVLGHCARTSLPFQEFIEEQRLASHAVIEPEHVFFFVDPPYINGDQDGFTGYGPERWTTEDLSALARSMRTVHEEGYRFMLTHVETPRLREIFGDREYNFTRVATKQTISTTAEGRVERQELVIRNYR